jgi:ribonucleoside-diphosphate reductase alpha chain
MLNKSYGSDAFLTFTNQILEKLRDTCYLASTELAAEKGSFPALEISDYMQSPYIQRLPEATQDHMWEFGIRNSHLTSIAPTGTISLTADNVSSGIEPPFMLSYDRTMRTFDGDRVETVRDYAYSQGVEGKTANQLTAKQHLDVLIAASRWVDSAVSKTCNVGDEVTFEEFKDLYLDAWRSGCKGITTFRASGKRMGILTETPADTEETPTPPAAEACFIDPATGQRTCE